MAGSWLHSKSFRCLKYAEDCKPLAFSRLKWQIPMATICVIVIGRHQMCHGCHRAAASKPSTREPWRDALPWCVNRNFSAEVFKYVYCELRKFRQGCMIFGNATLGVALDDYCCKPGCLENSFVIGMTSVKFKPPRRKTQVTEGGGVTVITVCNCVRYCCLKQINH